MHLTSNRMKDNQEKNRSKLFPSLTSVVRESINPAEFLSSVQSNEKHALIEVQKDPDFKEFVKEMQKEIRDHENSDRWEISHKSISKVKKVLKVIWEFKRKHTPDGHLKVLNPHHSTRKN